jgi:hypothetical protein
MRAVVFTGPIVDGNNRELIDDWLSVFRKARGERFEGESQHRKVEREAIKISLDKLLSFP